MKRTRGSLGFRHDGACFMSTSVRKGFDTAVAQFSSRFKLELGLFMGAFVVG